MKILFTGGGTGGHFYPIIAIAEAIYEKTREKKIMLPKLYFMSPSRYSPRALFDNDIKYVYVPAGKWRRYFSLLNILDLFKTFYGVISAIIKMFQIYPDVVFGKGGYASFPALFAARILNIPVVIHESDSMPGKVNSWAGKFAKKIAISYPESAEYFKYKTNDQNNSKIAFTGLPIRKEVIETLSNGAKEFLKLENETPVVVILGGSQGAQRINDIVIDSLPELVKRYQIIHQTGKRNINLVTDMASIVLKDNSYSYRYHPFDYLNDLALRMSAGMADVIVSRAGSSIFEIATWGRSSIIIPLPKNISHDQTNNAFSYARSGACTVIEEDNFNSHIFVAEIDNIVNNHSISNRMISSAKKWSHTDASSKIAMALLEIGLEHQQ